MKKLVVLVVMVLVFATMGNVAAAEAENETSLSNGELEFIFGKVCQDVFSRKAVTFDSWVSVNEIKYKKVVFNKKETTYNIVWKGVFRVKAHDARGSGELPVYVEAVVGVLGDYIEIKNKHDPKHPAKLFPQLYVEICKPGSGCKYKYAAR